MARNIFAMSAKLFNNAPLSRRIGIVELVKEPFYFFNHIKEKNYDRSIDKRICIYIR
jgi:hypothetical protein